MIVLCFLLNCTPLSVESVFSYSVGLIVFEPLYNGRTHRSAPLCFYDNYLPIAPVFTDFLHILKKENCDMSIFVFQNATQWHVFALFGAFFVPKTHSPFHMFAVAHHFFALTNLSCMPGSFRC